MDIKMRKKKVRELKRNGDEIIYFVWTGCIGVLSGMFDDVFGWIPMVEGFKTVGLAAATPPPGTLSLSPPPAQTLWYLGTQKDDACLEYGGRDGLSLLAL